MAQHSENCLGKVERWRLMGGVRIAVNKHRHSRDLSSHVSVQLGGGWGCSDRTGSPRPRLIETAWVAAGKEIIFTIHHNVCRDQTWTSSQQTYCIVVAAPNTRYTWNAAPALHLHWKHLSLVMLHYYYFFAWWMLQVTACPQECHKSVGLCFFLDCVSLLQAPDI